MGTRYGTATFDDLTHGLTTDGSALFRGELSASNSADSGKNFAGRALWLDGEARIPGLTEPVDHCMGEYSGVLVLQNSVALWLHSVNGTFVSYEWHECANGDVTLHRGPISAISSHDSAAGLPQGPGYTIGHTIPLHCCFAAKSCKWR